ncbi:MAG: hypothetical protein WCO22_09385 [Betaproteobacteria bacterium]
MALAILSKQFGDFNIFRANLQKELESKASFPYWLQISPTVYRLPDHLRFDFPSLTFLFECGRSDVVEKLFLAETKYHDLRMILERNSDACEERDQILAKAGFGSFALADLPKAEVVVGSALKAKCENLNIFLQSRAERDGIEYQLAGESLQQLMNKIFGAKKVIKFKSMLARDSIN